MRIAYITHTRFPTEKAHGNQIAHVCSALTELHHSVDLIAPAIYNDIRSDPLEYYGVEKPFTVKHLPIFDALYAWFVPGRFAFAITMRSYKAKLRKVLRGSGYQLLYARSPAVASALLSSGIPTVLELHTLPRRGKKRFVKDCNACRKIVCLTSPMRDELVGWGVDKKKIIVEGDAVDIRRFSKLPLKATIQHQWDLPEDRTIIGYVGSYVTFDSLKKGVDVILQALLHLRKQRVPVFGWFVGGPEEWATKYRKLALASGLTSHDMRFDESVFTSTVPEIMAGCDICVYPAPKSKHAFFQRDTSPLKLFEYLASGTPAVVADIPPVRDIVDSTTVKLFHPGSASSLAGALLSVIEHPKEARQRAGKGLVLVKEHTWKKRMQRIMDSL